MKKQLFGRTEVELKILERYELSGQYTPEKLLELYKDSILYELKHYSILEYNLFRGAKISFPEEHVMRMELQKTTLGEDEADELIRVLYKIFTERCGMDLRIQTEFVDREDDEKKKKGRIDIDRQAARLIETMIQFQQTAGQNGDAAAEGQPEEASVRAQKKAEGAKQTGAQKKEAPKKSGEKKGYGSFGQSEYAYGKHLKSPNARFRSGKSNNPDVLFGRDFDDSEILDLVQLVGEMGRGRNPWTDHRLGRAGNPGRKDDCHAHRDGLHRYHPGEAFRKGRGGACKSAGKSQKRSVCAH